MIALALSALLAQTTWPPKVTAEALGEGPAPKVIATGATGAFDVTADGKHLVFIDGEGVKRFTFATGDLKTLGPGSGWLHLSRDSRYVMVPGAPLTRYSVAGKEGAVTLAKGVQLNALTGLTIGPKHFAFIDADGALTVTALDEGTSVKLPIPMPNTRRCHVGPGFPRSFSDDGKWLLFQHGCADHGVIRVDGTGLRLTGLISAKLVGDLLVGTRAEGGVFEVSALDGSNPQKLEGSVFHGFMTPFPQRGAMWVANADRLELVDFKEKKTRTLLTTAPGGSVIPFLDVSADGKSVFAATQLTEGCEVFRIDVASGQKQRLAALEGPRQCFVKSAGPTKAGLYAWTEGNAALYSLDVTSGRVERLGTPLIGVGNFMAGQSALVVHSGGQVRVADLAGKKK
jgi:hypothetical protein